MPQRLPGLPGLPDSLRRAGRAFLTRDVLHPGQRGVPTGGDDLTGLPDEPLHGFTGINSGLPRSVLHLAGFPGRTPLNLIHSSHRPVHRSRGLTSGEEGDPASGRHGDLDGGRPELRGMADRQLFQHSV